MCIIIRLDETYYLKVKSDITPEFIIKQIIKNCGMRKDSFGEYYVKRILNNILSGGINLTEFYENDEILIIINRLLVEVSYED